MNKTKKFSYDEIFERLYTLWSRSIGTKNQGKYVNPYTIYQELRKAFEVCDKE